MIEVWLRGVATQLLAQPLGTVLNMGSSGIALIEILPRGAARRIVLTEPDPVQVHALQRQFGSNPAVTIVPAAITEATGPVTLHRFNLAHAAALRPASGLKMVFPGLLDVGQIEVPTQTVEATLQVCDLDTKAEHVLILGAAGEEMAVIESLIALGAVQLFDHIIVPLPSHPLYEESADGAAIRKRLESAGFRISSQDMSDPDLSFVYMRLNRDRLALVAERHHFAEANSAAEARIGELASERDATETSRQRAEQEKEALRAECVHLSEAKSAAEARISELASERDAAETSRQRAEQDIVSLREALEISQQESASQKKAAEEAERAQISERDHKQQIQIFDETYRHALRLELLRPKGASGALRTTFPVAIKLLSDLDSRLPVDTPTFLTAPKFNLGAFKKAANMTAAHVQSHIVLDVKSVPRSGLHYMKRQFAKILQDGYSFCEWYQEPGCCKRMPCVHFPNKAQNGDGGSLRMLKSHDFENTDPVYPVTPGMQRLILTRDPIFILTSQWLLSLLAQNKDLLKENDIQIEKIYYLHEPEILTQAYELLDATQTVPDEKSVVTWLKQQQTYLPAFSAKWGIAAAHMPRTYIVPYNKTPLAIARCLAPIKNILSHEQHARLETHVAQWQDGFKPRGNPFKGPTPYLTTLLQRYTPLFQDAAEFIRKNDTGGLFGTAEAFVQDEYS